MVSRAVDGEQSTLSWCAGRPPGPELKTGGKRIVITEGVRHGSAEEKDVALPHPTAQGGGDEDASRADCHLPQVRPAEAAAPCVHG